MPGTARTVARALHTQISEDIAGKIRSGLWAPGFRIPYEHELTVQYGCARATVSKAVQTLAAAGLIDRRRKAGSFVAQPHVQSAVLEIPDIQVEIEGRRQTYGYELRARRRRRPGLRESDALALGAPGSVLDLHCRHFANGRPFAAEARLINLAAVPEAAEADFTNQAPGAWLLRHVSWTEAEHRITALPADGEMAALLDVKVGHACLAVKRWTWRLGEGITFARQVFPGEVIDLVAKFTPGRRL